MKKILLISTAAAFLAAAFVFAQSAAFPGGVATDTQLAVAANRVQTTLTGQIGAGNSTITVANATGIAANMLLSIDSEIMFVSSIAPITVIRGFDSSSAASHSAGAIVSVNLDAWHHNAVKAEVEAIESTLNNSNNGLFGSSSTTAHSALMAYWSPVPVLYNIFGVINPSGSGSASVPSIGNGTWMRQNNGNGNDAVALFSACEVNVTNGKCFGMNIISDSLPNVGVTNPTTVGLEIDLQPYATPTTNSFGLAIDQFNFQNPSPAVIVRNGNQAVTSPAWGYGFFSEDNASGTGLYLGATTLGTSVGSQPIMFHTVDAGSTSRTNTFGADLNGTIGLQNNVKFRLSGTASANNAYLYNDGANNLHIVPGNNNISYFKNTADNADGNLQAASGYFSGGGGAAPAIGFAASPTVTGIFYGTGSPNSAVTANPGSLYLNTSGGASTTLYVKESGTGTNTGWVGK